MTDSALSGECFRCGYDLRGLADEQACPECGLLAARSRRSTDELHDTRPQWLRRLAWGVRFLLLSILTLLAWPLFGALVANRINEIFFNRGFVPPWMEHLMFGGPDMAAVLWMIGVLLLTCPEGYQPADRADVGRRRCLRVLAFIPLLAGGFAHVLFESLRRTGRIGSSAAVGWIAASLFTASGSAMIVLLFLQLRSLAGRARSAHLAEHCAIVGIGAACAVVYALLAAVVTSYGDEWFGWDWSIRSSAFIVLNLTAGVAALLFMLWALYVLLRFAIAVGKAHWDRRRNWRAADRAAEPTTTG